MRDRLGRVDVAPHLGSGGREVEDGAALVDVDGHLEPDHGAVVHEVLGGEDALPRPLLGRLAELLQHGPHRDLGVGLDVGHVGLDDVQAVGLDEVGDELDPPLVGRDLRLEVGQVVLEEAGA